MVHDPCSLPKSDSMLSSSSSNRYDFNLLSSIVMELVRDTGFRETSPGVWSPCLGRLSSIKQSDFNDSLA